MVKQVLIFAFVLSSLALRAQDTLFFTLTQGPFSVVKLAGFYADRIDVIDSTLTNSAGEAKFILKPNLRHGQYAILLSDTMAFDFFYSGNNLIIKSYQDHLLDSLTFNNSVENNDFQEFVKREAIHDKKMQLLNQCLDEYPKNDPFYNQLKTKAISEQIDYEAYINQIVRKHPEKFLAKYLNYRRPVLSDASIGHHQALAYKKLHYFDRVDFNDTSLLHSNAYSRIIISYLSLYSDPDLNLAEQQKAFNEGIKIIMDKTADNRMVYEFVVTYLIDGFERFGFDDVITFISDYYVTGNCENEQQIAGISGKINKMKKMLPGNKAPELIGTMLSGEKFDMSNYKGKWKLIVFWASWCPHCDIILPKLHDFYTTQNHSKWEVMAYSLDTDKEAWKSLVEKNHYTWPNISELKGWDSKTVTNFGISATPTIYLIDPNNIIVAKPTRLYEIKELLKQHNLL
jgi:thiol-disulfide isomerase/thioredoxin